MDLKAVFETWHLGDGNYPPLFKGMLVNLSFELEADEIGVSSGTGPSAFQHLGEGNYQFRGRVLRAYKDIEDLDRLLVLDCSGFNFYVTGLASRCCEAGDSIEGRGTLLLDHYLWVEFLDQYTDPPDLFYKLRVDRIWKNRIPKRHILRTENSMSQPTRLRQSEDESIEVEEIVSDSSISYYVVEFSNRDVQPDALIPVTFLGK